MIVNSYVNMKHGYKAWLKRVIFVRLGLHISVVWVILDTLRWVLCWQGIFLGLQYVLCDLIIAKRTLETTGQYRKLPNLPNFLKLTITFLVNNEYDMLFFQNALPLFPSSPSPQHLKCASIFHHLYLLTGNYVAHQIY